MTRPFLVQKFCKDPNPHGPHKWPLADGDEDARFWCVGVQDVPVRAKHLGDLAGEMTKEEFAALLMEES